MSWLFLIGFFALSAGLSIRMAYRTLKSDPEPTQEQFPVEENEYASSSRDRMWLKNDAKQKFEKAHAKWEERNEQRKNGRGFGWVFVGIGVFLIALCSFVVVPTNSIAIPISFGKPTTALANGLHGKAPWAKVVKFDASRQYLRFGGKGNEEDPSSDKKEWPCVSVKMAHEATSCLSMTVAWQLKATTPAEKQQAIKLFKNFKTFDRITENYMAAGARGAAQTTYSDVNPLSPDNPTFSRLSETMLSNLRSNVGSEINIVSVQITNADYDAKTDEAIASMQAEYAKQTQAELQKVTNTKQSEANAKLQSALTDEILKDNCIKGALAVGQNPGPCLQPGWGGAVGAAPAGK